MRKIVLRHPFLLLLTSVLLAGCANHELSTALPTASTSALFAVGCDADEGVRTTALIDAITDANTNPGADVIDLAPGCTYTLTSVHNNDGNRNGLPVISGDLTINGNGATIRRSAEAAIPAFVIISISLNAEVLLNSLTIADGSDDDGGGILNRGTLTLTNSTLSNNQAWERGGGIFNSGNLTITNSTISNNIAFAGGGIENSGTVTITNSTLSGNSADAAGGGIFQTESGSLTITNSIVALNTAPNGPDVLGTITSASNNLIGTPDPGLQLGSDDKPLLQDNGGPTKTIALVAGSPAIDAALLESCPTTDQRGVTRPQGAACDIGAFEVEVEVERPLDIQRPSIKIEQVQITSATRAGTAEGSFVIRNASGGEDTVVTLGEVTLTFRSDGRRVRTWHTATCDVTPLATGYELDPAQAETFTYACETFVPAIPETAVEATAVVTVATISNQVGVERNGPPRTTSSPLPVD